MFKFKYLFPPNNKAEPPSFWEKPWTLASICINIAIWCILDLIDPYGRHYRLSFRSWNRILDIILHDKLLLFHHSLLPFLPSCFFTSWKDLYQWCHSAMPHKWILFEAYYFLWNSCHTFLHLGWSLVPKMVFISQGGSIALFRSYHDSYILMKLSLPPPCLQPSELQVPLHVCLLEWIFYYNCHPLFFEPSIILCFLVGDCTWSFLQVKFSCMIRNIS